MRNKLYILFMFVLILSIVIGCGKNGDSNENKDSNMQQKNHKESHLEAEPGTNQVFPEVYEKSYDSVHFDTTIIIKDKETQFVTTHAELQKVDPERAFDIFFEGMEVLETYEDEGINEKDKKVITHIYVGKNGESLSIGPYSSMCTFVGGNLSSYVPNAFRMFEKYDDYNADKYSQETQFDFATQEEAFQDIKRTLSSIGIEISDTYKAYSLDYETMQKEEYVMGMDGKEDKSQYKESWSEEDNCYYFLMRQEYNNLPEYHVFVETFKKAADENTPLQVIYSKDGIELLQLEKVFDFEEGTPVSLCPFEKIAETVADKYNMLLTDTEYNVMQAELYYMVDISQGRGRYTVIPAWILDIEERFTDGGIVKKLQMVVNAVNGDEIL